MRQTYLNRILFTYTMITFILLSMIFLGYFAYIWNYSQNQVQQSYIEYFLNYVDETEDLLATMNFMAATVSSLKSLDLFVFSSESNYFERLTLLFSDLATLNQKLAERDCLVSVHKVNDSTVLSSISSLPLSQFLEEYGIIREQYRDIQARLMKNPFPRGYYCLTDERVIYITSKDYLSDRVFIHVAVDSGRMNRYEALPGMELSYSVTGGDVVDLRRNRPEPLLDLPPPEKTDHGELHRREKGGDRFFWSYSNRMGIAYDFSIDNSIRRSLFIKILVATVALFVLICFISYLIILYFSRRIYRPIEDLLNTFHEMGFDYEEERDAKSELDFMATKVLNIRNYNRELIAAIENSNRYSIDNVIYELLTGSYNRETIFDNLKRMSIEWLDRECSVIIFPAGSRAGRGERSSSFIGTGLLSLIGEQLEGRLNYVSTLYPGDLICFIVDQTSLPVLREHIKIVISVIDTALPIHSSAIIGSPSSGINGIQSSFSSANRILENLVSSDIREIYDYNDLTGQETKDYVIPVSLERQLLEGVDSCSLSDVRRILQTMEREYVRPAFDRKELREPLLYALGNMVCRSAFRAGLSVASLEREGRSVYSILLAVEDPSSLVARAEEYFLGIMDEVNSLQAMKIGKLKKELEEYIEDNLQNNISLIDISLHFNFSSSYMSNIFKQNLNENFRDYLSRRRFEVAAGILRDNPDAKLTEIAERVGFNNVNTLIRTFHKYSGKSPGKFLEGSDS